MNQGSSDKKNSLNNESGSPVNNNCNGSSIGNKGDDVISDVKKSASPVSWRKVDESKQKFTTGARQNLHCSLFCGGAKCKHEDWTLCLKKKNCHPAIIGLNSNWVGDDIVASQRPSTSLFAKYPIIKEFKEKGITAVFNLEEKGEHYSCGPDGVYPETGYSYHGERDLMWHDISYYEFPWPDMMRPNVDIVLRSVKIIDKHIREKGKVLIHCHAGLGRTGLMIACYLLFRDRSKHVNDVITLVRTSRPGAIQTSNQTKFVKTFDDFMRKLFFIIPKQISDASSFTLKEFLKRQENFLHGTHINLYKDSPMHIYDICCQLIALSKLSPVTCLKQIISVLNGQHFPDLNQLDVIYKSLNDGRFSASSIDNVPLLSFAMYEWFKSLSEPVLNQCNSIEMAKLIERLCMKQIIHTKEKANVTDNVFFTPKRRRILNVAPSRAPEEELNNLSEIMAVNSDTENESSCVIDYPNSPGYLSSILIAKPEEFYSLKSPLGSPVNEGHFSAVASGSGESVNSIYSTEKELSESNISEVDQIKGDNNFRKSESGSNVIDNDYSVLGATSNTLSLNESSILKETSPNVNEKNLKLYSPIVNEKHVKMSILKPNSFFKIAQSDNKNVNIDSTGYNNGNKNISLDNISNCDCESPLLKNNKEKNANYLKFRDCKWAFDLLIEDSSEEYIKKIEKYEDISNQIKHMKKLLSNCCHTVALLLSFCYNIMDINKHAEESIELLKLVFLMLSRSKDCIDRVNIEKNRALIEATESALPERLHAFCFLWVKREIFGVSIARSRNISFSKPSCKRIVYESEN